MENPRLLGRDQTLPLYRQLKSEEQLLEPASSSSAERVLSGNDFKWNGRPCTGTALHLAVLTGDVDAVSKILDAKPDALHARFTYHTYFQNRPQEGTGEAIHLAASRGHVEMMRLLLSRGSELRAMVTRDGKDHYDVFHAAVFAEGRNDNQRMVRHLIKAQAPIGANSDGKWPLDLAFQVGSVALIKLIRNRMRGLGQREETQISDVQAAPLLLGIRMGKMTTRELARAAAHTPDSLHTFIRHEPRCIPEFLKQLEESDSSRKAWQLAKHIKGGDLARVIRRCPEAARALFDAITATPDCEHPGWHPLPRRVSFAPQGLMEKARHLVNPQTDLLVHYVKDTHWKYDVQKFEAPEWHKDFLDPTRGDPVHDVTVQVCRVPDLLCAEFFAALAEADADGELEVFDNAVVSGSVHFVWWNGAWRVDVLQCLLGIWGLTLLILESWIVGGDGNPFTDTVPRSLTAMRPHTSPNDQEGSLSGFLDNTVLTSIGIGEVTVSAAFIGAKGLLDVLHELAQFVGCVRIGRPLDYANMGNAWDLFRALVLMALFFDTRNSAVRVLVIFICWMRLLEMFTSAENIALALLPLKRLARSLVPASLMTLVAFLAFTHVFHFVWGHDHDWRATFFRSFSTLITTELPQEPAELPGLELLVTYSAVLFFSIFILNIFIGVIGTVYEEEKGRVPQTFLHHRACCCLNFLLRARVLPCGLWGRSCANATSSVAIATCLGLQLLGLMHHEQKPPMMRVSFFACQLVMLLAAYQSPASCWAPTTDPNEHLYLWLTTPWLPGEEEEPQEEAEGEGSGGEDPEEPAASSGGAAGSALPLRKRHHWEPADWEVSFRGLAARGARST